MAQLCLIRNSVRYIVFVTLMVVAAGCVSQIRPFKQYADEWVGEPITRLAAAKNRSGSYASRSGWQDNNYKLDNGNWVYVSPEKEDCIVHWEVNPSGVIVGYRTEGNRCNW